MQRRWQVFWIVSAGVFLSSLDLFIVNIAFPDIHADFAGTTLAGLSWILNAYAIVFAALLVPAGRWADRAGRKRGFLYGLALFTIASTEGATAHRAEAAVKSAMPPRNARLRPARSARRPNGTSRAAKTIA